MKKLSIITLAILLALSLSLASSLAAATLNEIKLIASDGATDDNFGFSVAISGNTLVVGAQSDDDNGSHSGAAYVFERNEGGPNNWGEVTKITPSDGTAGDTFGVAVAISGDTIVVGAHMDDDNGTDSGSAYVFERNEGGSNNWGEVTKITPSDGAAGDWFGYEGCVAISGDTIAVSSPRDDDNGERTGAVYVFERNYSGPNNWGEVTKITASDGAARDGFSRLSISGDTLVVGSAGDDDNGEGTGAVYVFERNYGGPNNWGEVTKITASDATCGDMFGISTSISGDTFVVGAYERDQYCNLQFGVGSAYVFERDQGGANNWGEVAKLTASDGAPYEYFGVDVFISGNTIVAAAHYDDDNGYRSGSAYVFERNEGGPNNWGEVTKITPSDGAAYDVFGRCVSISGNIIVAGSSGSDGNVSNSGAAYVYYSNQPPSADINGPYLGAAGSPIAFDGSGSSDPDEDPLTYDWDWGDGNTSLNAGANPSYSYTDAGIYDVCLTVSDGELSHMACTYAVIYDPSAGFVTGGGWIDSPEEAYKPDPDLTGRATFGFVSKYKKGANTPTGNTEFQFHAAGLNFHSSSYDWLVVTGSNYAKVKGSGTINGDGDYRFMLWAGDGDPDTFRIKIWEEDEQGNETVIYDNGFDQTIGGGRIIIHEGK